MVEEEERANEKKGLPGMPEDKSEPVITPITNHTPQRNSHIVMVELDDQDIEIQNVEDID